MNTQKGFSKIYIIIVILGIVALAWFYIIPTWDEMNGQKKRADSYREYVENNSMNEDSDVSENGTSLVRQNNEKWQTYTNNIYGFSFDYPSDWKISNESVESIIVAVSPKEYVFKDGTESPYGYFIVSRNDKEKYNVSDTGWQEAMFLGDIRDILTDDKKYRITLIPLMEDKEELEKILDSFKRIEVKNSNDKATYNTQEEMIVGRTATAEYDAYIESGIIPSGWNKKELKMDNKVLTIIMPIEYQNTISLEVINKKADYEPENFALSTIGGSVSDIKEYSVYTGGEKKVIQYSFVTSTNYKWNMYEVAVDENTHLEIGYSYKTEAENPKISPDIINKIIGSIKIN